MQYDPYGEVLTSTLPADPVLSGVEGLTDRLFTGQRFDSSTGLYYYNARYYDPHLGRFIQPDTLVPDPLNPQAWNRFSYVYNNPTSYVDPGGHIAWVPILIFGGAFLLGAGAGGYYAYHQGYGFESWQLCAYAGMGGLAGVVGAAMGMWIEAALLPAGATVGQAFVVGAAGGFAAGVVEQSNLEAGGAAILGTEVSAERILLAGVTGGVTGGTTALVRRAVGNYITRRLTQLTESAAQNPTLRPGAQRAIQQGVSPAYFRPVVDPKQPGGGAVNHRLLILGQMDLRVREQVQPARVVHISVGQEQMRHRLGAYGEALQFLPERISRIGCINGDGVFTIGVDEHVDIPELSFLSSS